MTSISCFCFSELGHVELGSAPLLHSSRPSGTAHANTVGSRRNVIRTPNRTTRHRSSGEQAAFAYIFNTSSRTFEVARPTRNRLEEPTGHSSFEWTSNSASFRSQRPESLGDTSKHLGRGDRIFLRRLFHLARLSSHLPAAPLTARPTSDPSVGMPVLVYRC